MKGLRWLTTTLIRCNQCGFSVPWDEIGAAIMAEHLKEHDRGQVGA